MFVGDDGPSDEEAPLVKNSSQCTQRNLSNNLGSNGHRNSSPPSPPPESSSQPEAFEIDIKMLDPSFPSVPPHTANTFSGTIKVGTQSAPSRIVNRAKMQLVERTKQRLLSENDSSPDTIKRDRGIVNGNYKPSKNINSSVEHFSGIAYSTPVSKYESFPNRRRLPSNSSVDSSPCKAGEESLSIEKTSAMTNKEDEEPAKTKSLPLSLPVASKTNRRDQVFIHYHPQLGDEGYESTLLDGDSAKHSSSEKDDLANNRFSRNRRGMVREAGRGVRGYSEPPHRLFRYRNGIHSKTADDVMINHADSDETPSFENAEHYGNNPNNAAARQIRRRVFRVALERDPLTNGRRRRKLLDADEDVGGPPKGDIANKFVQSDDNPRKTNLVRGNLTASTTNSTGSVTLSPTSSSYNANSGSYAEIAMTSSNRRSQPSLAHSSSASFKLGPTRSSSVPCRRRYEKATKAYNQPAFAPQSGSSAQEIGSTSEVADMPPPEGFESASPEQPLSYRSIVESLISANEPEKLVQIDRVMEKYSGREEELIGKLELRYKKQKARRELLMEKVRNLEEMQQPERVEKDDETQQVKPGEKEKLQPRQENLTNIQTSENQFKDESEESDEGKLTKSRNKEELGGKQECRRSLTTPSTPIWHDTGEEKEGKLANFNTDESPTEELVQASSTDLKSNEMHLQMGTERNRFPIQKNKSDTSVNGKLALESRVVDDGRKRDVNEAFEQGTSKVQNKFTDGSKTLHGTMKNATKPSTSTQTVRNVEYLDPEEDHSWKKNASDVDKMNDILNYEHDHGDHDEKDGEEEREDVLRQTKNSDVPPTHHSDLKDKDTQISQSYDDGVSCITTETKDTFKIYGRRGQRVDTLHSFAEITRRPPDSIIVDGSNGASCIRNELNHVESNTGIKNSEAVIEPLESIRETPLLKPNSSSPSHSTQEYMINKVDRILPLALPPTETSAKLDNVEARIRARHKLREEEAKNQALKKANAVLARKTKTANAMIKDDNTKGIRADGMSNIDSTSNKLDWDFDEEESFVGRLKKEIKRREIDSETSLIAEETHLSPESRLKFLDKEIARSKAGKEAQYAAEEAIENAVKQAELQSEEKERWKIKREEEIRRKAEIQLQSLEEEITRLMAEKESRFAAERAVALSKAQASLEKERLARIEAEQARIRAEREVEMLKAEVESRGESTREALQPKDMKPKNLVVLEKDHSQSVQTSLTHNPGKNFPSLSISTGSPLINHQPLSPIERINLSIESRIGGNQSITGLPSDYSTNKEKLPFEDTDAVEKIRSSWSSDEEVSSDMADRNEDSGDEISKQHALTNYAENDQKSFENVIDRHEQMFESCTKETNNGFTRNSNAISPNDLMTGDFPDTMAPSHSEDPVSTLNRKSDHNSEGTHSPMNDEKKNLNTYRATRGVSPLMCDVEKSRNIVPQSSTAFSLSPLSSHSRISNPDKSNLSPNQKNRKENDQKQRSETDQGANIYHVARQAFEGNSQKGQLSFSTGATVLAHSNQRGPWWLGRSGGRTGWFPASSVVPASEFLSNGDQNINSMTEEVENEFDQLPTENFDSVYDLIRSPSDDSDERNNSCFVNVDDSPKVGNFSVDDVNRKTILPLNTCNYSPPPSPRLDPSITAGLKEVLFKSEPTRVDSIEDSGKSEGQCSEDVPTEGREELKIRGESSDISRPPDSNDEERFKLNDTETKRNEGSEYTLERHEATHSSGDSVKKTKSKRLWRSAIDVNTGLAYYYHIETRETTWERPPDFIERKSSGKNISAISGNQHIVDEKKDVTISSQNTQGGNGILRLLSKKVKSKTESTPKVNNNMVAYDFNVAGERDISSNNASFESDGYSSDETELSESSLFPAKRLRATMGKLTEKISGRTQKAMDSVSRPYESLSDERSQNSSSVLEDELSLKGPSPRSVEILDKHEADFPATRLSDTDEEQHANDHKGAKSSKPEPARVDDNWRAVVDPATKRTYYYHKLTKETVWEKPTGL